MSLCKHCVSGVTHEGEAQGEWKKIGGVDAYVATPSGDYSKDKVILFLTDVFGPQVINARLLADDFARNGFKTVVPDYLNGEPAPLKRDRDAGYDVAGWLSRHGPKETRPPLDKVIEALKADGVVAFGATGYCFGSRYVFDLAFENIIKVAVVSHPALLEVPDDFKRYASTVKAPLLINSCEIDPRFPKEAQEMADDILGGGKFAPGYKREYFEGCKHGFAVRGDLSDPKVKAGKEGSFKAAVEWFLKYLLHEELWRGRL